MGGILSQQIEGDEHTMQHVLKNLHGQPFLLRVDHATLRWIFKFQKSERLNANALNNLKLNIESANPMEKLILYIAVLVFQNVSNRPKYSYSQKILDKLRY